MDFLELAKKRESTRAYSGEIIPREKIDLILEAGRISPSACNSQPWRFYVVDNGNKLEEMKNAVQWFKTNQFTNDTSCFIVMLGDKSNYPERVAQSICGRNFADIDMGIAVANMSLCATSIGLGTCIIGGFSESKIKDVIGIRKSDKSKVKLVLSVGTLSDMNVRDKKRKDFSDIVTYID